MYAMEIVGAKGERSQVIAHLRILRTRLLHMTPRSDNAAKLQ
jgi:hypothetical protein